MKWGNCAEGSHGEACRAGTKKKGGKEVWRGGGGHPIIDTDTRARSENSIVEGEREGEKRERERERRDVERGKSRNWRCLVFVCLTQRG